MPPDETRTVTWRGLDVTIQIWAEEPEFGWDGDGPDPRSEDPWCLACDLVVHAQLSGEGFSGSAQLGGCFGRKDYIEEHISKLIAESLADLERFVQDVAAGALVNAELARQAKARRILEVTQ